MDAALEQEIPSADDAAADVVSAVQRQHIIRFHQCLQAVGHVLLTDGDSAVRQRPRHIGKLVGIVGRIAVAVVADGINDEFFCNAFIIVEAVECCGIVLRAVMLQLGQTKTYCASHRIHEEVLDAAVQEYTETVREQCAAELKKLAHLQKMWALRKPILDAHILSLQEKVQELEQEIDEIVMEKLKGGVSNPRPC